LPWRILPEGPAWQYEVKLDGYRAIGVRTKAGLELWSRNKVDFSRRFSNLARALEALPSDTVLDGEIVAVNDDGEPSFSSLQNFGEGSAAILFYAFDAPVFTGADLRNKPLTTRREMLSELISKSPDVQPGVREKHGLLLPDCRLAGQKVAARG
jgi:ATP-dependent DNA ligase